MKALLGRSLMAGALVASVALAGGASAASGPDLLSVTTTGASANELSPQTTLSLSADGSKAVFVSASGSLVAGDTNGVKDVFLRNLDSGATRRVSVSSSEVQGDGASSNAMISADGRYVVFTSSATNLVAGDTNGVADVFVRDLATGATDRITDGNAASGDVPSSISADGSFVTFASSASNLVAGDSDGVRDVFLWNRSTGGTRLIAPGGASAIAADGAAIAVGGGSDIVLVDRASGSSTPLGAGSGAVLTPGAVAAGGSRVVFQTTSALAADDTNALNDVYAWSPGGVQQVSRGASAPGNSVSFGGWVSANGRYVAFDSQSTNLDVGRPRHRPRRVRPRSGDRRDAAGVDVVVADADQHVVVPVRRRQLGGVRIDRGRPGGRRHDAGRRRLGCVPLRLAVPAVQRYGGAGHLVRLGGRGLARVRCDAALHRGRMPGSGWRRRATRASTCTPRSPPAPRRPTRRPTRARCATWPATAPRPARSQATRSTGSHRRSRSRHRPTGRP